MTKNLDQEKEALIKKAQEQPGIKELMTAYGHYEDMVRQCNAYLTEFLPKSINSTSNNSSF